MSDTSKMHQQFVSSPLGDNILIVPGVGLVTASILQQHNLSTPGQLLGVYLQDPNGFQAQMIEYGIRQAYAQRMFDSFNEFSQNHIY